METPGAKDEELVYIHDPNDHLEFVQGVAGFSTWLIVILSIILFPPLGILFLLWVLRDWNYRYRLSRNGVLETRRRCGLISNCVPWMSSGQKLDRVDMTKPFTLESSDPNEEPPVTYFMRIECLPPSPAPTYITAGYADRSGEHLTKIVAEWENFRTSHQSTCKCTEP